MLRRSLLLLTFVAIVVISGDLIATVIKANNVSVEQSENALVVEGDFRFELSPRLEEALNHGVPLYFTVEFELLRPRWYWFDEKVASETRTLRLAYHTLSRQYRVSRGALYQNFPTLEEALRTLGTVRGWIVVEGDRLSPEEGYVAMLRLRLDTAQLPKPFQVSALTSSEWVLASDWVRVPFRSKASGSAIP